MEETNRTRRYERNDTGFNARRETAPHARLGERVDSMPSVGMGSVVAMVLGTLLLSLLAVWAIAQGGGLAAFSDGNLERHFCRYLTC